MHYTPSMHQVKASAGSGKTHDITGRFLDYLSGLNPSEHSPSCALSYDATYGNWADILAITFTNAAASEMKERVITRLKRIALEKESSPNITPEIAKMWVHTILRQYGSLNIRTIDSLLHRIVRTAALDLGLPPDFEISFATDDTLQPIFDALLERAWQDDKIIKAMLEKICLSILLREKSSGFGTGQRILDSTRPLLEKALAGTLSEISSVQSINDCYYNLQENLINLSTRMVELADTEDLQLKKNIYEIFIACTHADRKKADSAYLKKDCLSELILKKFQNDVSNDAKATYILLTRAAQAFVQDGHILRKALEWHPFVEFTKLIASELQKFQQKEHKVAAATMPLMAKNILNFEHGVSQALCRLGSRTQHILLDEFQDTSHEQWNALSPLAEEALSTGGSLTWVGDIKQAIYGWRGGDSDLFDELLKIEELTNIAGEPHKKTLAVNWRSREQIVKFNNKLFGPLAYESTAGAVLSAMLSKEFPAHLLPDATKKLCNAFADVEQKVKPDNFAGGYVSIEELEAEKKEDLSNLVCEKLDFLIHDLIKRRNFSDITILTRSNSGAATVAEWLMDWNIPVITENSLLLNSHPLIQESLALLSFLNTPHDDLSFWTLLTGKMLAPHMGKANYSPTMEQLHTLALKRTQLANNSISLSGDFQKEWPEFWENIFAPFYNTAQLVTPYDTMQEWYRVLQVFEIFSKDNTFLRRFLEIIHNAGEHGQTTLSTFLEYWLKYGADEKAPMPNKINAVQIMTIHKSKGLQFKVVILPWTSFSQKNNGIQPIDYKVQGLDVIVPRCAEMGDEYYKAQVDNALESMNTFYVACTRAEEELHIFSTHTPFIHRNRRNLACGLMHLLPAAGLTLPLKIGLPADTTDNREYVEDITEHDSTDHEQTNIKNVYISRPMEWMPRLKIFRNPLQELILTARLRGLLTHHCLEQFQSTNNPEQDAIRAVEFGLRTFSLPITQTKTLYDELVTALTWYATLPDVWTKNAIAEQSLMDENGKVFRADLLLPPDHEYGWRVIEFKTGEEHKSHLEQINNYLDLLNKLQKNDQDLQDKASSQGVLIYLDLQRCYMINDGVTSNSIPFPKWKRIGENI